MLSLIYSISDSSSPNNNHIRLKLKLMKDLKVYPTRINNEIIDMKSIKLRNLEEIDNCIEVCTEFKKTTLRKRSSSQVLTMKRQSIRQTEKRSYAEFSSDDTPPKKEKQGRTPVRELKVCLNKLALVDTVIDSKNLDVTSITNVLNERPKRKASLSKKYLDGNWITIKSPKISVKDSGSDMESDSFRLKRNVIDPKRYIDDDTLLTFTEKKNASCDYYLSDDKTLITPKKHGKCQMNFRKAAFQNSCTKRHISLSDKDDDFLIVKTPKCAPSTAKSTPKSRPSARARMIREGIITPSMHQREVALIKDNTPLSKARTQLHVSYIPNSLPCREKEFNDIMNFLEGKLLDGCGGCIYISGVPGTGKTATVMEVVRVLENAAQKGKVPLFTYINVNGMKLSEPRQAYVEIAKQLTGRTLHWEQAHSVLDKKFVKPQKKMLPIILLVDELDILCTKRQDVVYNLLDWPTKANNQLVVITIANTMDLPERLLMGRVTSRLGLTRLSFQAYSHNQLQEIVQKRLSGISAFNPDAIQLVARKVASVSGDARRALDICRRAVEIAELENKHNLVSLTHVNQALNAMITQPKVLAIKSCTKLEKLILKCVVAETERTGVEETSFTNIFKVLATLSALDGFKMVSSTIALATINKLGLCRLLLIDQKCNNINQKIILNVSTDDVYYALTKTDL